MSAPCGHDWCDCACYLAAYHCKMGHTFAHKIGVERTVPHALASSASVSAVEQLATAHAAAPAGTEAPSP
jgi:hypothetical protein